nr:immunoglobulin heavy chain junction region [Macaca mulatta]MOY29004.1 immunoglobulin heavy chain junction region [Macaca mulatta]MOY30403.1 immunoglobulin heavy chain junction region [Macaca mulatta]
CARWGCSGGVCWFKRFDVW